MDEYRDGWISRLYVWLVFVPMYTLAAAALVLIIVSFVLARFGMRLI